MSSLALCESLTRVSPMTAEHLTWVECTLSAGRFGSPLDAILYSRAVDGSISLLRRLGADAVVAHPVGHPEAFVGWAIASNGRLASAYVKPAWRKAGIARRMIAEVVPSPTGAVPVAIWTDYAEDIKRGGFPIFFDLKWLRELARLGRTRKDDHDQS